MRNLFLLLLIASLFACETDFQLEGEWKDIPVVYAFLSPQDTAHYVRVERAFLEPGGDANVIAQLPDSIYYGPDEVVVRLEKVNTGAAYELTRVDGAAEGYPREDGAFANNPNILYKLPAYLPDLDGGERVRVIVDRGGATTPAEAETVILKPLTWSQPPVGSQFRVDDPQRFTSLVWRAEDDYVQIFDLRLTFRYRETDPNDPAQMIDKEIVWVMGETLERDEDTNLQTYRFRNDELFQFIASQLEPLASGVRRFSGIDVQVTGVGEEIAEYLTIANANIGITSSQSIPRYTNVEGGYGLVSSRVQLLINNFSMNSPSRDTLYNGYYTGELGFVP
ncbi:MAG: DUF4249 family protein [Lewinella sp.]|nr:DUF4249 family protein [Lewinella sp.]